MDKLRIEIEIDIDDMKIYATHNIPEADRKQKTQVARAYKSILQGVCRSFGGIIYALIQPRKDTLLYETDRMHALSMISKSIDQERTLDEQKNRTTVAH